MNHTARDYSSIGSADMNAGRSATPPPAPLAPVHAAQAQLVSEIDALHSVIGDLYDRLGAVMGPPGPSKGDNPNKIAQADVTVAQRIDSAARNVRNATDRLMDIRTRLEI